MIQAARPTVREPILKLGQPKITRNQVQVALNALCMRRSNIASPSKIGEMQGRIL